MPPVSQEFTAEVSDYLAKIQLMIAQTKQFAEEVVRAAAEAQAALSAISGRDINVDVKSNLGDLARQAGALAAESRIAGDSANSLAASLSAEAVTAREVTAAATDAAAAVKSEGKAARDNVDPLIQFRENLLKAAQNSRALSEEISLTPWDLWRDRLIQSANATAMAANQGDSLARVYRMVQSDISGVDWGAFIAGEQAAASKTAAIAAVMVAAFSRIRESIDRAGESFISGRGWGWLGFLGTKIAGISAWHWILEALVESLIAVGTAAMAAAAGFAVLQPAFADFHDHAAAVWDVNSALGNQIPGLIQQFKNLAASMAPQALEIYGGMMNLVSQGLHSIQPIIEQVVNLFDTWIAKIDIWARNSGLMNRLLADGVQFLSQFGQLVGFAGDALKNLLTVMPGVAHWWLDLFIGIARVIDIITKIPASILTPVIAIHGLYLMFRLLGGGIAWLVTRFGPLYRALAALAANPLVWVAAAAAAVGYLAYQSTQATTGAKNFIAAIDQKLAMDNASKAITGISQAIGQLSARIRSTNVASEMQSIWGGSLFNRSSSISQWTQRLSYDFQAFARDVGGIFTNLFHGNIIGAITSFGKAIAGIFVPGQGAAIAAANDINAYNAAINRLLGNQRNLFMETGKLVQQGYTWRQALALMDLAGVKYNDSAAVMAQKVNNLIQGYQSMSIQGGLLKNSVNAITFATDQQDSKVGQLTQAWSTFFQTVSGGASGFVSFAQALGGTLTTSLRQESGATTTTIRTTQGLAQAFATAKGNMTGLSTASLSAQGQFIQTAQAAQTEMNNLTMLASAAGLGAKGTAMLTQASKDMVASLLPAAQHSRTLTTVLYALAQQGGYEGANSFKALSNWVGKTHDPMKNLQGIVETLTVAAGNLTTDVKNLSTALGTTLNQAMAAAIFYADGGQKAFNTYAQALTHTGVNSITTYNSAKTLAAELITLTGNTSNAHREFDTMSQALGLTKRQSDQLWASVVRTAQAIANLRNKHVQIFETGTGKFSINYVSQGAGGQRYGQGPGATQAAEGGFVRGPGTSSSDSIPARLSAGEYVVRAASVAHYGRQMLEAINTRRFAEGGFVYQGSVAGLPAATTQFDQNFISSMTASMKSAMTTAMKSAISQAQAALMSFPGVHGGAVYNVMVQIAKAMGWRGMIGDWWNVIMRECHDLDTEILTRRGWLRHDQVQVGDETLGYNPVTGCNEWTRIIRISHYDDAPLLEVGNLQWRVRATPEHRWWSDTVTKTNAPRMADENLAARIRNVANDNPGISYRAIARRLGIHHTTVSAYRRWDQGKRGKTYIGYRGEFVTTAELGVSKRSLIRIRTSADATTDGIAGMSLEEVAILAWLQTDGRIRSVGAGGRAASKVIWPSMGQPGTGRVNDCYDGSICQSKPAQVAKIRALLAPFPHSEQVYPPVKSHHLPRHEWCLRRSMVTDLVKKSGVMTDGPEFFVLSLSPEQRAVWLATVIDAEGHVDTNGTIIAQTNGPVCDAIALAIYLSGYRPSVRPHRSDEKRGFKSSSEIGMVSPHVTTQEFQPPVELEYQPVWCPTTELGTWTAKQDRHIFLTGNSGGSLTATNPSSGAYGLAQFINGPGEYYQWGGNPNTVIGQLTAMANYIRARYGNPAGAWGSELSRGWYDQGGWLMPGVNLAINNTGKPEQVLSPGTSAGEVHVHVHLEGDAQQLFRVMSAESYRYNVRNSGAQQSGVMAPTFGRTIFKRT